MLQAVPTTAQRQVQIWQMLKDKGKIYFLFQPPIFRTMELNLG